MVSRMADDGRLSDPINDHWQWWDLAACRGMLTTLFFHPERQRGPARRRREAEAKAVCHRCPVITQCRRYAVGVQEPYGIWGGLSAEERKDQLRASRGAPSVPRPGARRFAGP